MKPAETCPVLFGALHHCRCIFCFLRAMTGILYPFRGVKCTIFTANYFRKVAEFPIPIFETCLSCVCVSFFGGDKGIQSGAVLLAFVRSAQI